MEIIITALLGQAYRAPLSLQHAQARPSFENLPSVRLNLVFSTFYNLVTYNPISSDEHPIDHLMPGE